VSGNMSKRTFFLRLVLVLTIICRQAPQDTKALEIKAFVDAKLASDSAEIKEICVFQSKRAEWGAARMRTVWAMWDYNILKASFFDVVILSGMAWPR
jgi:hypothetical protein